MVMKISVIGTGYVGLVTGTCFAEAGNDVTLVDIVKEKVENINKGIAPIYEDGLEDMLKRNLQAKRIRATLDLKAAIQGTEVTFISVGTPSREDGSIDLKYIEQASRDIGSALKDKDGYHVVVVKSTVVPRTTEDVVIPALEEASGKRSGKDFGVCMNPEFLKEGKAVEDFMKPDRIVIGQLDERSGDVLNELYRSFSAPIIRTSPKTAEMIKYAANAFLAAKIGMINEIGNLCKRLEIDTNDVANGIGHDTRIGHQFLRSGIGFGGSCFPKDVKALIAKSREVGYEPVILDHIIKMNEKQPLQILELLKRKMPDISGKTIAVLGLAFKADTDDIRESPALKIVAALLKEGANVRAYDPKAMDNFRKEFPNITYCSSFSEAVEGADACLILTDWKEFDLSEEDFESMSSKLILEGRKILNKEKVSACEGVCW
jgi:UDPglucose 6-dehydrogenase